MIILDSIQASPDNIEEHPYYKKLKKELNQKKIQRQNQDSFSENKKQTGAEESASVEAEDHKIRKKKQAKKEAAQLEQDSESKLYDDKVELSDLKWEKEAHDDSESDSSEKKKDDQFQDSFLDSLNQRSFLHVNIDYKKKEQGVREGFKHALKQRYSHNTLYAKFSAFKSGVLRHVLSIMGVSDQDVEKMEKEANNEAIDANKEKMSDTLYRHELMVLMSGANRKNRSQRQLLQRTKGILIREMKDRFGDDYWTQDRLLEEQTKQLGRIKEELLTEEKSLSYQVDYLLQNSFDREQVDHE